MKKNNLNKIRQNLKNPRWIIGLPIMLITLLVLYILSFIGFMLESSGKFLSQIKNRPTPILFKKLIEWVQAGQKKEN